MPQSLNLKKQKTKKKFCVKWKKKLFTGKCASQKMMYSILLSSSGNKIGLKTFGIWQIMFHCITVKTSVREGAENLRFYEEPLSKK